MLFDGNCLDCFVLIVSTAVLAMYCCSAAGVEVRSVDNTAVREQQVQRLRKVRLHTTICVCFLSHLLSARWW